MSAMLSSKFRGCFVGSLLGDCLGAPFEGDFPVSKSVLTSYISKLLDESAKGLLPFRPYTDDTAMTKCLAASLIEKKGFHAGDLAQRFTTEYFEQPKRGYGSNVVDVFRALKRSNFEDPFGPAKDQFQGTGSYGNGGAMRVAPVALFWHKNLAEMVSNMHENLLKDSPVVLEDLCNLRKVYFDVPEQGLFPSLTIEERQRREAKKLDTSPKYFFKYFPEEFWEECMFQTNTTLFNGTVSDMDMQDFELGGNMTKKLNGTKTLMFNDRYITDFKIAKHLVKQNIFLTGTVMGNRSDRIAATVLQDRDMQQGNSACKVAEKQARITHTHRNGYNGSILQCLAVRYALMSDSKAPFDKVAFLKLLLEHMDAIESKDVKPTSDPAVDKPFTTSLQNMQHVLCDDPRELAAEEIAALFGNDVSAHKSVPTAIYAFLRSHEPLPFFQAENPFVRAIVLSISVGGDTDTIATMAGSISGAFHGIEGIPTSLQRHCEDLDLVLKLADDMYELVGAH